MNASIPTDDDLRDLMRAVVDATPPAPSFDEALARAAHQGVTAGPEFLVPASPHRNRSRRRSIGTMLAAILVALGLTGGGYLAYATFIGPDGYDSPTEAVEAFIDAASDGDLLRASRALPPFERDHMTERLDAVLGLVTEKGLLAPNDLGQARNVGLHPAGLRWSEHEMARGFSRVEADTGTLDLTFDGRLFGATVTKGPGPQRIDLVQRFRPSDPDGSGGRPAGFVTTRVDGKWYVSFTYSVFETIRLSIGASRPEMGSPIEARGAATPEEAARATIDGIYGPAATDLDALLPVIDPVAGEAFHRYLSVLVEREGADLAAGGMRSLAWSITGSGDRRVAHLDRYETPVYDAATGEPTGSFHRSDTDDCRPADQAPFGCAMWDLSVALVERDGRWYADPIETVGRIMTGWLVDQAVTNGAPGN